jgi:hypothetical protein
MPGLYQFDFMNRGFPYTDEDGNLLGPTPSSDVPTNDPNIAPPGTPPSVPAPAPYVGRTGPALEKLRAQIEGQPKLDPPKWWQSLAAGAAGFGAGWSNAAGRSRHPIDVDQMREDILHPGYREKMADWQSRVKPLEQQVKLAEAADAGERADRLQAAQQGYYSARANEANAKALKAARDDKPGKPTEEQKYETALSITKDPVQATRYAFGWGAPSAEKEPAHHNLTPDEILLAPPGTYTPEQVKKANEILDKMHRGGGANVDPLLEERRRQLIDEGNAKAFDTIENTKRTAESGLLNRRKADIDKLIKGANENSRSATDPVYSSEADLMSNPALAAQVAHINQNYAGQYQQVLDGYARSIRNRHGSAENWQVDPKTFATSKVEAPAGPAASPAAKGAANNRALTMKGNGGPKPSPNDMVSIEIEGVPYHGTRAQMDALMAEAKRQKLIKE